MSVLTIRDVRPSVAAFAVAMEEKLRANAHKGDRYAWQRDPPLALCNRVAEECDELTDEVTRCQSVAPIDAAGRARIRAEAADVGNMAMMVADACGAFTELAPGDE